MQQRNRVPGRGREGRGGAPAPTNTKPLLDPQEPLRDPRVRYQLG